jgi:hypothetical protein
MGNRDGGPFPEYPGQREQVLKDAEALVRAKFPSGIADELLKDPMLFVGHKIIPSGRGTMGYDGMIMGHSYWFIRDKEIDAVAALGTVATAIVGFTTPLAFAVPLLITLAGVLKQAADKHIEVSERDAALLLYLKHNRAQSEAEILNGLNGIRAQTSFTWNEHDLRRQLERLQKVHLADGTLEALVTQASDGRWRTNGR